MIPKRLYRRSAWGGVHGFYITDELNTQSTDIIDIYPPPSGASNLSFMLDLVGRPALLAFDIKTEVADDSSGLIGSGELRMLAYREKKDSIIVTGEVLPTLDDKTFIFQYIPEEGSVVIHDIDDDFTMNYEMGTATFEESQAGKELTADYTYLGGTGVWEKKECYYWHASWGWHRCYTFFRPGTYMIIFQTENYAQDDKAYITRRAIQYFDRLICVGKIERFRPPKPVDNMVPIELINGFTRYQDTGSRGANVEFAVTVHGTGNWQEFMQGFREMHILDGNEGLFAGFFITQDIEQYKMGGDVYMVKLVLNSPSEPGAGNDYFILAPEYAGSTGDD